MVLLATESYVRHYDLSSEKYLDPLWRRRRYLLMTVMTWVWVSSWVESGWEARHWAVAWVVSGVLGMWWVSWAEVTHPPPAPSLTTDAPEAIRVPLDE